MTLLPLHRAHNVQSWLPLIARDVRAGALAALCASHETMLMVTLLASAASAPPPALLPHGISSATKYAVPHARVVSPVRVPQPTKPFRAWAFTPNITNDTLYHGSTLSTDEGVHTTEADVRTMLLHGVVGLRNAPGPGPTGGACLKKRLNHSACVERFAASVALPRGAAVTDGIEWSGRSINEWTLGNRTRPRKGEWANETTLDFAAVAAEGYRLAKKRDSTLFLACWATAPDDTLAALVKDGTIDLVMVEGYSFCPLFNCSRPVGDDCGVVPGWGPCGHSVSSYVARLEWAKANGFIDRTIFFFGWLIARSPLVPHGWTPASLRSEATRLRDQFPEMPGMGLYTSSRIAHPMTHSQETLLRAASNLMSELYPSLDARPELKHLRVKSDDRPLHRYENRGTFDKFWGETSPLVFHDQLVRMETRYLGPFSGALDASPEPDHLRIRGVPNRNVIIDPIPSSRGLRYGSGFVDRAGNKETLYAFGSNWCDAPDPSQCQHGTNGTRVMAYGSSDPSLQNWTVNVALELPEEFKRRGCRVFNTDVHYGAGAVAGGYKYVMAMEMQGHPWCPTASRNFFAVHKGGDLSRGWRLLNVSEALHPQPGDTYPSECMTLRFHAPYYYLIFGSYWQVRSHNESRSQWGPSYFARMVQYVSRSRDLRNWELALTPLVTPGGDAQDSPNKALKDGYVPSAANAQALKDMNDTNVSDLDMVDMGNGTVYIEWAMGCQEPGCNGNLLPNGDHTPAGMFLVSATTVGTSESWLASAFAPA